MAAGTLAAGAAAPEVDLPLWGGGQFHLAAARQKGPVLLAFFKVNCPVCQFSFPFLQRLASRAGNGVQVVGVGQNGAEAVARFARQYGVHFPIALDAGPGHGASRAYGLDFVPAVFWIGPEGRIRRAASGFDRDEFSAIAAEADAGPLFSASELRQLPARRPG